MSNWFTVGGTTDGIGQTSQELRLKDGGQAVLRFVDLGLLDLDVDKDKPWIRIRVHRISKDGRFLTVTSPIPPDVDPKENREMDPLYAAGSRLSWQWVSLVLLRASEEEFHQQMLGRVHLLRMGVRAVEFIRKALYPDLAEVKKVLTEADLKYRRVGTGKDTQYSFILANQKELSEDEQKAFQKLPDLIKIITPPTKEELLSLAGSASFSRRDNKQEEKAESQKAGGWSDFN
jgi:hypothetical protein